MKQCKSNEPTNQNSSSQKKHSWSEQDRKALIDLFALLLEMEIDQQNKVSKEYPDAKQVK